MRTNAARFHPRCSDCEQPPRKNRRSVAIALHVFRCDEKCGLKASFNGKPLHPADRKGEFYPNPHPPQLTGPDEAAQSWRVPPDMPHAGENTVEITALTPTPAHAIFLDLALP